jgi:hypothetical protein
MGISEAEPSHFVTAYVDTRVTDCRPYCTDIPTTACCLALASTATYYSPVSSFELNACVWPSRDRARCLLMAQGRRSCGRVLRPLLRSKQTSP